MADERDIAGLMEKYRQPAILIHRPYPPLGLPPRRSHLGGRPSLPEGYAWPRMGNGTPLHFLAQIDCGELPPTGGVLPETGALFFFARIDEDMLWGDDGEPAHDYCRVLFAPLIAAQATEPPPDLPEIMFGVAGGPVIDFKLPEDAPIRCYPEWPVDFHPIQSWPDASAFPDWTKDMWDRDDAAKRERARASGNAYREAVKLAREAELVRVLGEPIKDPGIADWRKTELAPGGPHLTLPFAPRKAPFPQVWIMIDRIARNLMKNAADAMWRPPSRNGPDPALLREIRSAAMAWVDQAATNGLETPTDAQTASEFSAWLKRLAALDFFHAKVSGAVKKGVDSAIQFAATAPLAAAAIPIETYLERGEQRTPHQMLGNARSTQTARPVERREVLLLQLRSDYGVNFMFCDTGEVEFWIDKDDLAARCFDKVFATTCGG